MLLLLKPVFLLTMSMLMLQISITRAFPRPRNMLLSEYESRVSCAARQHPAMKLDRHCRSGGTLLESHVLGSSLLCRRI